MRLNKSSSVRALAFLMYKMGNNSLHLVELVVNTKWMSYGAGLSPGPDERQRPNVRLLEVMM